MVHDNYAVVFEVSSGEEKRLAAGLRNVENAQKALGREDSRIEVVVHGQGLTLVLDHGNRQKDRIKQLQDTGVVFAACENTMRSENVSPASLIKGVVTVDSGVGEIIRRQKQGWAYIKS